MFSHSDDIKSANSFSSGPRTHAKSVARAYFDPFKGNNQDGVFETLDELKLFADVKYGGLAHLDNMEGMIFQEVDFSELGEGMLDLPLQGAAFLGCIYPPGVTDDKVRAAGARLVSANPQNFPFKLFRAFLYTQVELTSIDKTIYEYWLREGKSFAAQLAMSVHDFSMMDALMDYAEGKSFVAICGGHALKRSDDLYGTLVELGNRIAISGFICVTGGGPGAMEASNLGAYVAGLQNCSAPGAQNDSVTPYACAQTADTNETDSAASGCRQQQRPDVENRQLEEDSHHIRRGRHHLMSPRRLACNRRDVARALHLIQSFPAADGRPDYENSRPAEAVVAEFGLPRCYTPSLGIPTWRYGHEPPNLFTSYHAKFFQNAIREDILLQICFGGLIITPGGPGTMQEIFQAACINAYCKPGYDYPMVFLGVDFWKGNGVWEMVCRLAADKQYARLLLLSDSVDEIIDHLLRCARQKGLGLISDFSELCNPYWYSKTLFS